MLLKLEAAEHRTDLDPPVGFLDLDIIVNFDAVPPHRGSSRLNQLIPIPAGRLRDEVKGVSLPIRAPGVDVRDTLHTKSSNPVGPDLPVIGIFRVLPLR